MKPEAQIHSDRRLPSLTGLRIFAALAVYLSHIGPPAGSPEVLTTFMLSGYSGVTIFFVLSGFVLALNYFETLRRFEPGKLYSYFLARFARVYPLYLLVLLFIVVKQHAFGVGIDGWWKNTLAVQAWDSDIFAAYAFNGPSWSVSVEFFLYACFPLLIPLIARLRKPRGVLAAAAGVAAGMALLAAWFIVTGRADLPVVDGASAHRWLYRTPLTRLGDFVLGILAARLFVQAGGHSVFQRIAKPVTVVACVVLVGLMCWPALYYTAWSFDVAYAVPAVILIFGLAVAPLSLPARFLSLSPIVLLGESSYAFYLIHWPAIGWLGGGQWTGSVTPSLVLYEAMILGAILAFSVGLHVTVELPARKWLRQRLARPTRARRSAVEPQKAATSNSTA